MVTVRLFNTREKGEKHTWQVYVTSELKMKLFCFFTSRTMVWIFIGLEKRYLSFSCTKILTIQNETKRTQTE